MAGVFITPVPYPRSPVPRLRSLVVLLFTATPTVLHGQRETVLKQIQLPHHYYYREMYLPQATSGPSAVTWSPEGSQLIYSMQGTLWRQRLGTTQATQLTDGPGYDHQPDWSPDGRFVAYSSYRNDAMELWLLDLATGTARVLVADGGVNVEPRWAPDGNRIAYVSTAFQGRWHIFVLPVANGQLGGPPTRLTTDHDSGLPRYYYSVYDHYLSPSWSPDGRELILVSNAGRIWGTGGLWRMDARPDAEPRLIHDEETTWKARPDWSRDGKRVVYSSYLGRQWNQLWLMTGEGGDPFQLTYGEFDNTAPRWSPDGRRIAYVSNEGGNTSLRVVNVPGGQTQRVEATARRYLKPHTALTIRVTDVAGKPIAARVSISGADGRGYAPDDAWRHADDGFDRTERRFEFTYFHTHGASRVQLPEGTYRVEVTKGYEYARVVDSVRVDGRTPATKPIRLTRLADLPARGWFSGDLHVHMNYGGTYRNTPANLRFQAEAEDLHVVESLVVNKEARIPDITYFSGFLDPVSSAATLIKHDEEYHTSYWGHTGHLGLTRQFLLPNYAAYVNTAAASLFPHNSAIFDLSHAQGGVSGYVHPFETVPDPAGAGRITHELPVDAALGKVDYLEVAGFSNHLATAAVWYRLLGAGLRLPAGAGTDAMANFASLRGPVGLCRVFVRSGGLDYRAWLAGLKAGKTFATNGPLLGFTLGGRDIGGELKLPDGRHQLDATVWLRSIVPVDSLQIVGNGEVVRSIPLAGDHTAADARVRIPVDRSGWYTLRAFSRRSRHPVLDIYPFATTSPIYVLAGGKPIGSATDAAYFAAWIERLEREARAHRGWNGDAERDAVLADLARARERFRQLEATAGR